SAENNLTETFSSPKHLMDVGRARAQQKGSRRPAARNARLAHSEVAGAGTDARLRRGRMDSRKLPGRLARGGRRALSGIASAGIAWIVVGRVGHIGKQPAGEILRTDGRRQEAIDGRNRVLAANVRRGGPRLTDGVGAK